jgi:Resolvase, N terminal domain
VNGCFNEKVSGVVTDRRQLVQRYCWVVTKMDRLAGSLRDLLNTVSAIRDRSAGFRVFDQPALDTTSSYGQLPRPSYCE